MKRSLIVVFAYAMLCAVPAFAQQTSELDEDVMAVLGRPVGSKPAPTAVSLHSQDIDSKLRCPVCQGVSIADSPSGMATKMRAQVRDLVAAGYNDEQVMSYFEHSYGELVRLEPPLRGINWLLWVMPGFLLLSGALFVFWRARSSAGGVMTAEVKAVGVDPASVDPVIAKYLEQIRRDSGQSS